ncbi:hypothetical protein JRQ81_013726 [Phrynocephalus forsythii]|uniref:Uncharacterized protein n=1 Tax=Phrynocephalus forsythii TaxID=171643 RepID=A0A9Q0XZQ3_9SAUR|nr:hypothetical protein JRQ81_013726 [Phrynocephalus forsythii]
MDRLEGQQADGGTSSTTEDVVMVEAAKADTAENNGVEEAAQEERAAAAQDPGMSGIRPALRLSELVAGGKGDKSEVALQRSDVSCTQGGVTLYIRRSKTDQTAKGTMIQLGLAGTTRRHVLIWGHSFIYWAAKHAHRSLWGNNLVLATVVTLEWKGIRSMRWADVLPTARWLAGSMPPDLLLLYAGGNDLGWQTG